MNTTRRTVAFTASLAHVFLSALLALANQAVPAAEASPRTSAAVVFVGHSLINYEMPQILQRLAESRGFTLQKAVHVINGAPLRHNWEVCRSSSFSGQWPPDQFACDAIERGSAIGPYDTLIATDANDTIERHSINNETHRYLGNFMEMMLARNPDARIFMYTAWEAWGYHQSIGWLDAVATELAVYETIVAKTNAASTSQGRAAAARVLPANIALRELIRQVEAGSIPGISARGQLFADSVHMSPLGNYFLASVVFAAVYNRTPEGAASRITDQWGSLLIDVPSGTAAALHRLAWQVVSTYSGPSSNTVRPRPPVSLQVS